MKSIEKQYTVAGVMSGTSLDGLDIALCRFTKIENQYNFEIIAAQTFPYTNEYRAKLSEAHLLSAYDFIKFHKDYGTYIGNQINVFLHNKQKPDFIASHGQTIFHQPEEKVTFQIGDGSFIAAECNITTISDFRNLDTALGGQGAPLVPIGDKILFSEYQFCINLGGFANISYDNSEGTRIAFDICPVNILANMLSNLKGQEFDMAGDIGKQGEINQRLLDELNAISFYQQKEPKSLGREHLEQIFIPIFDKFHISPENKLRTLYEHIAIQINAILSPLSYPNGKILFTGGGAFNTFLISLINKHITQQVVIPSNEIVNFKEALIFAFLGVLRIENEFNCLQSVTGASRNCSGGVIWVVSS